MKPIVVKNSNSISVQLSQEIRLEFLRRGDQLVGLQKVIANGIPLRNQQECIFPEIGTPDGWEIDHYEYCGWIVEGDSVIIKTKPYFRVAHRMEWSEHALHLRINTASWSTGAKTVEGAYFNWLLRPCTHTIGRRTYYGFSYGFEYSCDGYRIYQIEDKATWELGGDIQSNTFVMRGSCEHPVFDFSKAKKDTYYSGWNMMGIANPYIFQHHPLYTQLQGFTFQYDKDRILVTRHVYPSHVRSFYQRSANSPMLLHFNQFCFDLTDKVKTPAREILVCECGEESFESRMNHFLRLREEIQTQYRNYYGVSLDKARPDAHVETWSIANMEQFPKILKQLRQWHFPRSFIMALWRSNETEVVPRFKEDKENFGFMGNMCCPLDLEIASCYGGDEGMAKAFSCTKDLDMETYMWFGSHFSSVTDLGKKIPDLFSRDVSGQNQRNNYGHVLWAVNQNSKQYREYLLQRFLKLRECGITGVFRDSHCNMASDTINYLHSDYESEREGTTMDQRGNLDMNGLAAHDQVKSMHDTELSIQKSFQDHGLLYYVESMGIFGTPMCGTDYNDVIGSEFIYQDVSTGMNSERVLEHGITPYEAYFRAMAARMFFQLHVEVNSFPAAECFDEWWDADLFTPLLKAYAEVEPYLGVMWLLPDDLGIMWEDEAGHRVVFAYKNGELSVPAGTCVKEVISQEETKSTGSLTVEKLKIYYWET